MKTDIQIAQEAVMEPIAQVAGRLGIQEDELELYGRYKAKLSEGFLEGLEKRPSGKLILVTAINPTPAGEGKTTTSVGLGQAFGKLGKRRLSLCGSLPWVPASASRAERQEADMRRWFPWRS